MTSMKDIPLRALAAVLLSTLLACSATGRLDDDDAGDDDSADDDDVADDDDATADPVGEGLVAHWRFDEVKGSVALDSSGGETHCTATGTEWSYGQVNGAVSLDGESVIDCGDILNDLSLPVTLAMWVRSEPLAEEPRVIVSTDDPLDVHAGVWLSVVPTRALDATYGDGGDITSASRRSATSGSVLAVEQWVHVAVVIAGPLDTVFYFDGEPSETAYSGSGSDLVHTTAPFVIGNRTAWGGEGFVGRLDDFRVYARGLDSDEVAILSSM